MNVQGMLFLLLLLIHLTFNDSMNVESVLFLLLLLDELHLTVCTLPFVRLTQVRIQLLPEVPKIL